MVAILDTCARSRRTIKRVREIVRTSVTYYIIYQSKYVKENKKEKFSINTTVIVHMEECLN